MTKGIETKSVKKVFKTAAHVCKRGVKPGREQFAFVRGFENLAVKYVLPCKNELCATLGWNNRTTWYMRLYGDIEPRVSEKQTIETIFAKYGVKKDIWGV